MFRALKWSAPVVALAVIFSLAAAAPAKEEAAKETGKVTGTVVDKDGKPVSGVPVRLFHPFTRGERQAEKQAAESDAPKPSKDDKPKPIAVTTTDKEGNFALNEVPVGKYTCIAMLRGQGGDRKDVEIKAGDQARVDLKLHYKDKAGKAEKSSDKAEKAE